MASKFLTYVQDETERTGMLRVKYELDRLGMTQAAFATKANVNPAALSRIVNGKERAYPKRGRRIADALGWRGTLDELFGELEVK